MNPTHPLLALRAEALTLSDLSADVKVGTGRAGAPAQAAVREAVTTVLHDLHTPGQVGAEFAQMYGDHPDTTAARMRWALAAVSAAYTPASRIAAALPVGTRPHTGRTGSAAAA